MDSFDQIGISIIIPTFNEENNIGKLLSFLIENRSSNVLEMIVVDGGSTDGTEEIVKSRGKHVSFYLASKQSRAYQMNIGAKKALGEILYFVHADTIPPATYAGDIEQALNDGYSLGCYRYQFDSNKSILKVNAHFTRYDRIMCRGGDQTLFVTRALFEELEGYNEKYVIMEDYDFILRARKQAQFRIIPKNATVSARKYDHNSYLRVNVANLIVFIMFFLGFSPEKMLRFYCWVINRSKG